MYRITDKNDELVSQVRPMSHTMVAPDDYGSVQNDVNWGDKI